MITTLRNNDSNSRTHGSWSWIEPGGLGRVPQRGSLRGRHLLLRPGDPAFDPAGKPDLLADLVRRSRGQLGNLPEVENAEVVELLFDRRRHTGEFLEIVGHS